MDEIDLDVVCKAEKSETLLLPMFWLDPILYALLQGPCKIRLWFQFQLYR